MANKANVQKAFDETVGTINSALAVLNNLPELDDSNYSVSLHLTPFDFIMQLLSKIVSYDKIVEFVAKILAFEVPVMEVAVKTYMLTQLKLLFNCSVNPLITYELIRDGVVFDLKTIDLMNILRFCPLDPKNTKGRQYGRYYYFGCEEMEIPDDLRYSKDFNAFLWYVTHRRIGEREVWYGYKRNPLYEENGVKVHKSVNEKQKRKDGIITLEYNGRSSGLSDAEGHGMNIQTPFNNCLHVFLGNTAPFNEMVTETTTETINTIDRELNEYDELVNNINTLLPHVEDKYNRLNDSSADNGLDADELKSEKEAVSADVKILKSIRDTINKGTYALNNLDVNIWEITTHNTQNNTYIYHIESLNENLVIHANCMSVPKNDVIDSKKEAIDERTTIYNTEVRPSDVTTDNYRKVRENYYYLHPLAEFNIDYIMSLKLFDSVTLAAQLLDALSGCLTFELNLSFEEILLRNEVERMVHDILDTDDTVINDCFYSFDNNAYNQMLERARLQRIGVSVLRDGSVGGRLTPEDVLGQLNNISPNATQEQIQSAISSALFDISKRVTAEYDNYGADVNFNGINVNDVTWQSTWQNLLNQLLNNLSYVLVLSVLSPKLYLLMAINLKIMGQEAGFDLIGFLEQFKQMIAGIIRTIRDELMRLFKEWLMSLISDLAKNLTAKMALEQVIYYKDLLMKCIECFRIHGSTADWNMADVDYSDIYETETEPINNEC